MRKPAITFRRVRNRNDTDMGKMNVKNGTPVGNTHLCKNCNWGQFMTGYRESDLLVICTNTSPNIVVPFTVLDCSEFNDKFRPDFEQMKNLAISVAPARITRTPGFSTVTKVHPIRNDEDEDEVARLF